MSLEEIGATKVRDTGKLLKAAPAYGRGLLGFYTRRYVMNRPGNILFHMIGAVCFAGYCMNYSHISNDVESLFFTCTHYCLCITYA